LLESKTRQAWQPRYIQVLRLLETFALEIVTTPSQTLCGWHDQLRRGAAPLVVPHRATATAAGYGELATSAAGSGANHTSRRLHVLLPCLPLGTSHLDGEARYEQPA